MAVEITSETKAWTTAVGPFAVGAGPTSWKGQGVRSVRRISESSFAVEFSEPYDVGRSLLLASCSGSDNGQGGAAGCVVTVTPEVPNAQGERLFALVTIWDGQNTPTPAIAKEWAVELRTMNVEAALQETPAL